VPSAYYTATPIDPYGTSGYWDVRQRNGATAIAFRN
jgi:hypothetical protein